MIIKRRRRAVSLNADGARLLDFWCLRSYNQKISVFYGGDEEDASK